MGMKGNWRGLLSLVLLLTLLAGCGVTPATPSPSSALRTFTDATGRIVTVPAEIEKVAVTGPLAQMVVFSLAPDKLVGIANAWSESAQDFLNPQYYHLPVLGQLYGGKGELNLEALLDSGAQVVIDVGEAKDSVAGDMESLTQQTGIPFVHISATLETLPDTYTLLGQLLNLPRQAAQRAEYCRWAYEQGKELAGRVEKVRLLYLTGPEGLNIIARGSYHSEVIDLLSDNLAVVDTPSSKGTGNEADMEQLLRWDPDYILFAPGSVYDQVASDPVWQSMKAVAAGNYVEVPQGPDNWMGFPPSVQRLLGMLWMGQVLYPREVSYDLFEEVQEYYALFYHCDLTREQYDALVARSLGR